MNKELQKFFGDNDVPILYDLKDEFKVILEIADDATSLEKWQKYKSYDVDRYSAYGIDCDVSVLAVLIYKEAWDFLNSVNRPTKQYEKVSLDKISEFSIYKKNNREEIIPSSNIFSRDNTYICFSREYKYQLILRDTETNLTEYYRGDTMTSFTNIYNHYIRNFNDDETISTEIEKLAKNHHTIGNMIPVPTGFNTSRAGSYAIHDYWDLAMIKIKEWCDNTKDDEPLYVLLHNDKEAVNYCKKWLSKFNNNWNEFIERNYLQSFVNGKNQDGEYQLLAFWNEHSYDNDCLPMDRTVFLNFLELLNGCIETRNINVLNQLK